jgi:hypothetical protein
MVIVTNVFERANLAAWRASAANFAAMPDKADMKGEKEDWGNERFDQVVRRVGGGLGRNQAQASGYAMHMRIDREGRCS